MTQSSVPPPVTQVMEAAQAWLPARLAAVERRLVELDRRPRRAARRGRRGDARRRRQAAAADAGAALRGPGGPARRRPRRDRRSSSSTWRRSSTTTSSTARRCAAAIRPSRRAPAASAPWRPATCCSRAPSPSSGRRRRGRQVELLSSASVALALGELAQRRDAYDTSISAERYLERCLLKTARLFECACLIGRGGRSDPGDGGPSTRAPRGCAALRPPHRARLPAPRRRARRHRPARAHRQGASAPTCSTAPSPCR